MGTDITTADEVVVKEFVEAHPNALVTMNMQSNNVGSDAEMGKIFFVNIRSCCCRRIIHSFSSSSVEQNDSKRKPSKEKAKQLTPLTLFEKEILTIARKDVERDDKDEFRQSVSLLDDMNLEEKDYWAALDILAKDGNSLKFITIPSVKRLPFLLNKIRS